MVHARWNSRIQRLVARPGRNDLAVRPHLLFLKHAGTQCSACVHSSITDVGMRTPGPHVTPASHSATSSDFR